MKDLNIPWSKLFTPSDLSAAKTPPTPHHNALSTLLMDDSPRKAELQPYNHLCVREYSNVIRNRDLASLQEEKARLKPPSPHPLAEDQKSQSLPVLPPQISVETPRPPIPSTAHHHPTPFELPSTPLNPPPEFQFDQSVGIQPGATLLNPVPLTGNTGVYPRIPGDDGLSQGVIAPQMLFKNSSPSILGYQNPQAFQQLSQSLNPFTPPQHTYHSQPHPHPPLTNTLAHSVSSTREDSVPLMETATGEAKSPSDPLSSTLSPKKRKRKGKQETEREASGADSTHLIEYDETLLAIVGILDEVKFQSNVASWVKANELWGPHPPHNPDPLTQKRFHKSNEDVATLSDSGSVGSGRLGEGKKKRRDGVANFPEATVIDEPEGVGSFHTPTNENQDQANVSEAPLWFANPPTVQHWVNRGRKALETLGIPIEHGLKQ